MSNSSQSSGHRVAIVVDREFGAALSSLASQYHVWIVESPTNTPAIQAVWATQTLDGSADPLGPGVTAFEAAPDEAPDAMCTRIVSEVDEHHGEFGHEPAWSEIRVIGVSLDADLEVIFRDIGALHFDLATDGFVCCR